MLGFALFACTKISTESGTGHGSNPWTVPGVVRIGIAREPDNLNPVIGQQQVDVDLSKFWAGYLIEDDDQNRIIPALASSVPSLENGGISPDGRTITYHFRRGVKWQDGIPFTARDVVFTWRAIMNPDNPVPSRAGYELIESIRTPDPFTAVILLRRAYAPFVTMFLSPVGAYGYCVLPAHLFPSDANVAHAAYSTMPIGTGPYRVVSYEPDSVVRMIANPGYWQGPPKLREVDVRIVPDENTLATLVKTREIDFYDQVPHAITRQLRGTPGVRIISTPFTRYADLGLNTHDPLLSDVRVRQALVFATDRPTLIEKVTTGADVLADSDQPPFLWAHDDDVRRYPYDPSAASRLLDAAGWRMGPDGLRQKNGVVLRLGLAGIAGATESLEARELIQQQWRQVGIDTVIKSYPSDILYGPASDGGIEMTGHFQVVLEGFSNGADPDDSILFECRWIPPNGENVYRFCDRSFDGAEEAALASYSRSVRKARYASIAQVLAEQVPIIPLWFETYDFAVNTDLKGFRPDHVGSPIWDTGDWRI